MMGYQLITGHGKFNSLNELYLFMEYLNLKKVYFIQLNYGDKLLRVAKELTLNEIQYIVHGHC